MNVFQTTINFFHQCTTCSTLFLVASFWATILFEATAQNIFSFSQLRNYQDQDKFHACDHETFKIFDGYKLVFKQYDTNSRDHHSSYLNNFHDCLNHCLKDSRCQGVNYDERACQRIENFKKSFLILSNDTSKRFNIFAEKICISDLNNKCQNRLWAFEHIIGYQLVYPIIKNNSKFYQQHSISNVTSARQCSHLCLNEKSFTCRSLVWNSTSRECKLWNLSRSTIDSTYNNKIDSVTLKNLRVKFIPTFPFSKNVHYIENKCIEEPKNFCDFKRNPGYRLKTVDSIKNGIKNQSDCRELCLFNEKVYHSCKSFEYDWSTSTCRLSHLIESTTTHILKPYEFSENATTYEISTCYNVSILCEPKVMKIQVTTNKLFNGKIYAKTQPKNCANDIKNQIDFEISMPYVDNHSVGNLCDTRQPKSGSFANDIIIQHHDLVLTTKDLALGVFCNFDLQNNSLARINLNIEGEIQTEKLKETARLPELSLHIVDQNGRDIDEVSIGDVLRVQIRMDDENTYGIFVRNLIAKDRFNPKNNFTLIDSQGCPVQVKMMREIRLLNENKKSLESYLEAFTFTGGSFLLIEVEVETCLDKCRPVHCQVVTSRSGDKVDTVTSYGRRRRRRRRWSSLNDNDFEEHQGKVLSMTTLSKSLLIRSRNEPIDEKNQKFFSVHNQTLSITRKTQNNVTLTKNSIKKKTSASYREEAALRFLDSSKSPSIIINERPKLKINQSSLLLSSQLQQHKPYFKVSTINKNYLCFEPFNLIILCGISFCLQALIFSIVFYVVIKIKQTPCRKRIHSLKTSFGNGNNNDALGYCSTRNPYNFMN